MTRSRWALRRAADWICAPDGYIGPSYPIPRTIVLGPGTAKAPVLTLESYEQARDTAWLLKAVHGFTTEIRKL